MTHFITDIESQTVTLDGRIYTAADCRHRLYEDFCRRYGPDSFHACLAAFLREAPPARPRNCGWRNAA